MDLARKDISEKLMIFVNDRKKWHYSVVPWLDRKRSCLKKIRGYDTEEEGGGKRHSFAR